MLEERRLAVLRAIVEDYVLTHEPVGSKAVTARHKLGVSPATVRNDMSALEEDGYIAQPHTSAGRVPTDKGYRLFVDRLSTVKPFSPAERKAIQNFLAGAVDLDDVVHRSVRLLAQLTKQVAVVQYPTLSKATVRHIELVHLAPARVLLVLITDTGRVEQRIIELGADIAEESVSDLRTMCNATLSNRPLIEAPQLLADLPEQAPAWLRPYLTSLVSVMLEALVEKPEERVALAGTANLTRFSVDFPGTLRPVLEALEEQVVLLRLLGEAADLDTVRVRIGHENDVAGLENTSVVTTAYGAEAIPLGGIGVLGPTRMDYPGTIGAVQAVARYVGHLLGGAS